jgi:hypothetical protein
MSGAADPFYDVEVLRRLRCDAIRVATMFGSSDAEHRQNVR